MIVRCAVRKRTKRQGAAEKIIYGGARIVPDTVLLESVLVPRRIDRGPSSKANTVDKLVSGDGYKIMAPVRETRRNSELRVGVEPNGTSVIP
jgi:hypothetical protein